MKTIDVRGSCKSVKPSAKVDVKRQLKRLSQGKDALKSQLMNSQASIAVLR